MVQTPDNPTEESLMKPGDVVNETCIVTTNEERTILSQARTVQKLEVLKRTSMKKGKLNEVYIISKAWYNKWKEYTMYGFVKRSSKHPEFYKNRPKPYTLKPTNHPGKIDNSDLLVPISDFLNNNDTNDMKNIVIASEKVFKKDFKMVSKPIWNLLVGYFGGGPTILRNLKQEEGSTEFDIYHSKIQFVFVPSREVITDKEYIANNVKMFTMYVNEFSTLNDVNDEINKILSTKENEALRLSLGITDIKKSIDFFIYKLKRGITYQNLLDFISNKIDDIKTGKTINAEGYLDKIMRYLTVKHLNISENGHVLLCEYSTKNASMFIVNSDCNVKNYMVRTHPNDFDRKRVNFVHRMEIDDIPYKNYAMIIDDEEEDFSKVELSKENNRGGLVGLRNLGNTCFMNTGLQCLSNCPELTHYFIDDFYKKHINKDNPIGSGGKLAEAYGELMKKIWYGSKTSFPPYKFKSAISKFQSMFSGFAQHDTHEFLGFLLDGLHEDLNKVLSKPYVKTPDEQEKDDDVEATKSWNRFLMRNQSLLVDLFYGMYKSTVYCQNKECNNISRAFDPFATLSLSITSTSRQYSIKCFFVFFDISIPILSFCTVINKDMSVGIFRKKIGLILGIKPDSFDILKQMGSEYVQINTESHATIDSFIKGNNTLYLVQMPPYVTGETNVDYKGIYSKVQETIQNTENNFMEMSDIAEIDGEKTIVEKMSKGEPGVGDKNEWIKAVLYQYSYDEAIGNSKPEERVSFPRIIYVNKKWTGADFYDYIIRYFSFVLHKIKEGQNETQNNVNSITSSDIDKNVIFPNLDTITKKMNSNVTLSAQKKINYPFIVIYGKIQKIYSCKMTLNDDWKNLVFFSSSSSKVLETIVDKLVPSNEKLSNYELLFKIAWLPQYKDMLKELYSQINEIDYTPEIKQSTEGVSLLDLIENFSKKEQLTAENQWFCPKCKSEQLAEKKMEIYSCPDVLIIHLKRFRNEQKLDTLVNFPLRDLDMTQYVKKNNEEKYIYDLFAVGNHYGSIHGGHYVAYAKNYIKDKWYEFNDDSVNEINESGVVTQSAYTLFYRRRVERNEKQLEILYTKEFIEITP